MSTSTAISNSVSQGLPEYISRIAYNTNEWRRPSEQRAKESGASYVKGNGFGHEDWFFRDEWVIDSWRYAFLQGINKSYERFRKLGPSVFNMTLFTIQPDRQRRYVARIANMELVTPDAAEIAVALFKRRGWYAAMESDVRAVNGETSALGDTEYAAQIFNVRFRLEGVEIFAGPNSYAREDDYAHRLQHYVVSRLEHPVALPRTAAGSASSIRSTSSKVLRDVEPFLRKGTRDVICTPEHAIMQRNLVARLRKEYPKHLVDFEVDGIDVLHESPTERTLYEIKSDTRPLSAIRQALGQLLEYAFFGLPHDDRSLSLVVVGRTQPSHEESAYLEKLRTEFNLPLRYEVVAAQLAGAS